MIFYTQTQQQLKVQINGILEELDSIYWPKMYLWRGDKKFGQGPPPLLIWTKSKRTATFFGRPSLMDFVFYSCFYDTQWIQKCFMVNNESKPTFSCTVLDKLATESASFFWSLLLQRSCPASWKRVCHLLPRKNCFNSRTLPDILM